MNNITWNTKQVLLYVPNALNVLRMYYEFCSILLATLIQFKLIRWTAQWFTAMFGDRLLSANLYTHMQSLREKCLSNFLRRVREMLIIIN